MVRSFLVRAAPRFLVAAGVGAVVLVGAAVPAEREADACSCAPPAASLVAPDRVDDAPLNAKVRAFLPSSTVAPGPAARLVLRAHATKAAVTTTRTAFATGGWLSTVELSPAAPLEPSTQYELALLEPGAVPGATVLGTFRTGSSADTTAPRLEPLGKAVAYANKNAVGTACQITGPWITIDGVRADDPGRAGAQLLYGIWLGDAAGNVDTNRPPAELARAVDGRLHLGRTSACDPHAFPLPRTGVVWLGIAAVDEAGNTSAPRRVRVDLAAARRP
jgi:hypothetical protein